MKSVLVILLLFSLALPGPFRAVAVDRAARGTMESECVPARPDNCSCCTPEHCGCVRSGDEVPAIPVPSLPPKPPSCGDPVLMPPPSCDHLHGRKQPAVKGRAPPAISPAVLHRRPVPLYIRHCAQLW